MYGRWEEIFLLTGGDVYCKKNAGVYLYIWSFQLWDFFSLHSRGVSERWYSQGFSLLFIISNTLSTVFPGAGMNGKLEHRKHSTVLLSPFRWDKWCFAFSISSLPKESDRKLDRVANYFIGVNEEHSAKGSTSQRLVTHLGHSRVDYNVSAVKAAWGQTPCEFPVSHVLHHFCSPFVDQKVRASLVFWNEQMNKIFAKLISNHIGIPFEQCFQAVSEAGNSF